MAGITAFKQLLAYGTRAPIGTGAKGSENPSLAPSLFWGGIGLFDPRAGYNVTRAGALGWGGATPETVNFVPSTATVTAIAAAQVPVAATPLTLVSATGAGITVLAAAQQVWPSGNIIPAGALAIDGATALLSFGTPSPSTGATPFTFYDPRTMGARAVAIHSAGDDTGATFLVSGWDIYGYPMTQLVTGVSTATVNTLKAFKYIGSITPQGTLSGSNVSVGQSDIFGFPLFTPTFPYANIFWNSANVTAATGFTAPDTTATATNLTGDVRGTYALQAASNNTLRLQISNRLSAVALSNGAANGPVAGMFGVQQA